MNRPLATLLVLLSLVPAVSPAAVPAGYRFQSLVEAIPSPGPFKDSLLNSQASLITAVNNNGHMVGFRVGNDGSVHGFNVGFGTNPKMTVVATPDFVALSAGDARCFWFFCTTEFAFGARLQPDGTALTAFVNTPAGETVIPGSLPLVRAPGHFVEENRNGIIASTQINELGQYGVLAHPAGLTVLQDIPWLIAINDLAEPLVLAYAGMDGDCVVFGRGCPPPPPPPQTTCVADGVTDTHQKTIGKGHESHGNGNGYGHYKCHENNGQQNGKKALAVTTEPTVAPAPVTPPDPLMGPLLIRLHSDGSTLRYVFPYALDVDGSPATLRNLFPLALSDSRAVLRGDVTLATGQVLDRRLLSCTFNPSLVDENLDGVVDCTGGMSLVGGSAGSIRLNTAIGFSLTNANLLAGNFGYGAAGVGSAFVLDLAATNPAPVAVSSLAPAAAGWEVHAITDANQSGKLVGYGYRDCAALPQAFFLDPVNNAPASPIRFGQGAFEWPARLLAGETRAITPTLSGGSGSYEFRTHVRRPGDAGWSLLNDWNASAGTLDAGSSTGDLCVRIEARDTQNPAAIQQTIVRYAVVPAGTEPLNPAEELLPVESTGLGILRLSGGDPALMAVLGAAGSSLLLVLGTLLLRRRRKP